MNFKASIKIIFSFVVFSCFTDQEVFYNPQGLCAITKIVFQDEINDKTMRERLYFVEGLTRFFKEKGIKEGDVIAKTPNKYFLINPSELKDLYLSNPHLPIFAIASQIDHFITVDDTTNNKKWSFLLKSSVKMTPAMKKFVNTMIEKGKSVDQNS
jgi:hypothetical protein